MFWILVLEKIKRELGIEVMSLAGICQGLLCFPTTREVIGVSGRSLQSSSPWVKPPSYQNSEVVNTKYIHLEVLMKTKENMTVTVRNAH